MPRKKRCREAAHDGSCAAAQRRHETNGIPALCSRAVVLGPIIPSKSSKNIRDVACSWPSALESQLNCGPRLIFIHGGWSSKNVRELVLRGCRSSYVLITLTRVPWKSAESKPLRYLLMSGVPSAQSRLRRVAGSLRSLASSGLR
jgi:hypothetical protein